MRRLLVIAWYFPPMGGGGVQRTLSFVRHLSDLGWRITVITSADADRYWARDESLLERVPGSVDVVRISDRPLELGRRMIRRLVPHAWKRDFDKLLELPDRQSSWLPFALLAAERECRGQDFDAVYSTSAPWSAHLVAQALVRRHRIRWVADFRDPWTLNQTFAPATEWHRGRARRQERDILETADVVLANTVQNAQDLHEAFGPCGARVLALPNGWEPDETANLPKPAEDGPLTLGYAGSFYAGYRPDHLFSALRGATQLAPTLAENLRVDLVGKTDQADAIAGFGLEAMVTEHGYLPQAEALAFLARSHAVLLMLPPHADSGWVPQKLYVYLRLGRPIIAVVPPGEARRILEEAGGRQLILTPGAAENPRALVTFLEQLITAKAEDAGFAPKVVARYDRGRLANTLDRALRGDAE